MTVEILTASEAGLRRAAELLRAGRVIAFPTDTVYGLAALARDPIACERIYEIKRRDRSQQLIAMAAEPDELASLVELDDRARWFADRWWPGPLTLVLPAREETRPTLGVRIPDHPVALALLAEVGEPLATTSANLSGEPPAMTAGEAAHLAGVAAVVDAGRAPGGSPSTVASLAGPTLEVLREGPVSRHDLVLHEQARNPATG